MEDAGRSHEMRLEARPEDADALGHVNNVVYVRWIQDAAVAHWRARATRGEQAALVWVVARHEVDYLHPAVPGDVLRVRTWVGRARGPLFERHTEIVREPDGRALVRALTLWCPLDAGSGRPCRVPAGVRERFSTGPAPGDGAPGA